MLHFQLALWGCSRLQWGGGGICQIRPAVTVSLGHVQTEVQDGRLGVQGIAQWPVEQHPAEGGGGGLIVCGWLAEGWWVGVRGCGWGLLDSQLLSMGCDTEQRSSCSPGIFLSVDRVGDRPVICDPSPPPSSGIWVVGWGGGGV